MNNYKLVKLFSVSALALTVSMTANANTETGEEDREIEKIMVTAQKRSQSLQEVPIAMSAFSADTIKQLGAMDFKGLTTMTPGFSVTGGTDAFPRAYIRGIGSNDTGIGVDPSVGVYIDGIYASRNGGALTDLMDIERVEILKGPQGTLFGRNSIGGAISIITTKPTDELEGEFGVEVGSFNKQVAKGIINIPLLDDTLYVRASGIIRKRDGWQENQVGTENGLSQDRVSGRLKFTWYPSENIEINQSNNWSRFDEISAYMDNLESSVPVSDLTQVLDDKKVVSGGLDIFGNSANDRESLAPILKRDLQEHSLSLDWHINDNLTFTSLTSYRNYDTSSSSDYEGTEFYVGTNEGSTESSESVSQEFRLSGTSDSLDWFFGASASSETVSNDFLIGFFDFGPFIGINLNDGVPFFEDSSVSSDVDSVAVFGDATWHTTDKLNITLGARYSSDDKTMDYNNPYHPDGANLLGGLGYIMPTEAQFVDENGNPDPSKQHLSDSWTDFSPRVVVDYKVTDDAMVFGSVTLGYKSGGFNTYPSPDANNGFVVTPTATKSVDPETATNYELGLKSSWLDGDLILNSSLFFMDYVDLQVRQVVGTVVQLTNAGEASNSGLEFDISYQVFPDLKIIANGTWMNAKYDEYITGGQDLSGTQLIHSPDFSGTFALDYYKEIEGYGELRSFISYSYKGDHFYHNGYEQEAYSLVNARISYYTNESWEFALYGSNLTDESYINNYSGNFAAFGFVGVSRNEPRTFGLSATYSF